MPRNLLKKSIKIISPNSNHEEWVCNQYLQGKSCNQISEEIESLTDVYITPKGIAYFIHKRGLMRTKRQSFINSIKTGRMAYHEPCVTSNDALKQLTK